MLNQHYIHGQCNVRWHGHAYTAVAARYDFLSGELTIQPPIDQLVIDKLPMDETCEVFCGRFTTPFGSWSLRSDITWLLRQASPSAMWIGVSPLSFTTGEVRTWPEVTLFAKGRVRFDVEYERDEIYYIGGATSNLPPQEYDRDCLIVARVGSVSVIGKPRLSERLIRVGLSLAAGDALLIYGTQAGKTAEFTGSNYKPGERKGRLLFYAGFPVHDVQLEADGLMSVFRSAVDHILSLSPQKQDEFSNAVAIYLAGRSTRNVASVKLLSAFHLLEFLDGSKTMSDDATSRVFEVKREEAKVMRDYRNDLMHNRGDLGRNAAAFLEGLDRVGSPVAAAVRRFGGGHPELTAVNYVLSLCDRALLRRVGYEGLAQQYLPTSEDRLRQCLPSSS